MKRAKRDIDHRAFKQGYNSGIKGHAKGNCPFHGNEKKEYWISGWRVGHADFVAGYRA